MSEGDTIQFGRVPFDVVQGGALIGLNRSDLLVYVALSAHVGGLDDGWRCWPSVPTLARITGLSDAPVRRALDRLKAAGLVTVEHRGGGRRAVSGRGLTNIYVMTTNPDSIGDRVSEPAKGDKTDAEGCQDRPDTLTESTVYPDAQVSAKQSKQTGIETGTETGQVLSFADADDDPNRLMDRLAKLGYATARERRRLIQQEPQRVARAVNTFNAMSATANAKGKPISNPGGLLRSILRGDISTGHPIDDAIAHVGRVGDDNPLRDERSLNDAKARLRRQVEQMKLRK